MKPTQVSPLLCDFRFPFSDSAFESIARSPSPSEFEQYSCKRTPQLVDAHYAEKLFQAASSPIR